MERLKAETQAQHTQLEEEPLLRELVSESLTLEKYARVLQAFYGFWSALERQLEQFERLPQYLPDFAERRKAARLREDLEAIQQPLPYNGSGSPQLPLLTDLAAALGCLYVLEGSTLGGQLIARNLKKTLSLEPHAGSSFFSGYGPETGSRWKAFHEAVLAFAARHPEQEDALVAAAQQTFSHLTTWMRLHGK